ncbi:MAG: dTDP-4-dehydrorhamnose reductase [Kiritimatiellae bacterium]|nr:dTDP-4-dehydrorhamnose reductase [Kiritimatiellia bacterium]
MRILITGGKGMLGRTLQKELAGHDLYVADLPECDMLDSASLQAAFSAFRPEAVIHCAAMTKVDDCETKRDLAYRLNETGSANVAAACREAGARLIAISTDYVFAGDGEDAYAETDLPAPRTVYGASKYAGERAVFAALPEAVVLRIAWLYGADGPSFIHTMAKLGAQEGAPLKVVDDQHGNPTSTTAVADVIKLLLAHPEISGVVHGTCEGVCSWYELTVELFRLLGLKRSVQPCTTAEFPRPAPRPANSALAKTVLNRHGYHTPKWQDALAEFARTEFPVS